MYSTFDFSLSFLFIALMMALLFFWHVQHRSLRGFVMITSGNNIRQCLQNVLYAADRCLAAKQDGL